MLEVFES